MIKIIKRGGGIFDKHFFTLSAFKLQIKNYIKYKWTPPFEKPEFSHHGYNIITEVEDTGEFIIETQKFIKK